MQSSRRIITTHKHPAFLSPHHQCQSTEGKMLILETFQHRGSVFSVYKPNLLSVVVLTYIVELVFMDCILYTSFLGVISRILCFMLILK